MPKALTEADIDLLATHVAAGDCIAYYSQLAAWDYRYGKLALGVVSNDTFAGRVANEYFVHQAAEEEQVETVTETEIGGGVERFLWM